MIIISRAHNAYVSIAEEVELVGVHLDAWQQLALAILSLVTLHSVESLLELKR